MTHPTPTQLKILRGNPGKQALNKLEPEPELLAELPEPPDFFNQPAIDEWWRIVEELHRLKMLTTFDVTALAAYCQSWGRWVEAERKIAVMRKVNADSALLVKGSMSNVVPNPLIKIARLAAQDMVRYAAEFGFTPAARSRIVLTGGKEPPSKFGTLLAN
jgi:P27 family predicted phage terminase small subunit